ncbi:hypothetical protein [Flavobacterium sp. N2038]|uniref:hypothetical protein n=1 Tax=Flavobacterium sp. N2038 TaxID=2986829 RepID=UPI0022248A63|nr:hypothetical protein [Flavobacterium sp. N2038]
MDILKKIVIGGVCVLTFISCKYKEEKNTTQQNKSEIVFKSWLRDTLNMLKNQQKFDYKRDILLSSDSLSLDIVKTFDKKINPKNIEKIKSKELIYAFDLLDRSHNRPQEEFKLKLVISSYYSVSMVEQLKYEYDSEIKLFDVIKKTKIEKYRFVKGNFIEKRILSY